MTLTEYLHIWGEDTVHINMDDLWYYHTPNQDVLLDTRNKKRIGDINPDLSLRQQLNLEDSKEILYIYHKEKVIYSEAPVEIVRTKTYRWSIITYPTTHSDVVLLEIQRKREFWTDTNDYITSTIFYRLNDRGDYTYYDSLTKMLADNPGFKSIQ